MLIANNWKDYQVIATSDGYKLERWGDITLLRPDPQVIWHGDKDIFNYPVHARYLRSEKGGGKWEYFKKVPEDWVVSYGELNFKVKPMGFKHTGLFPEQAANWDKMTALIKGANRPISALNLFAYTGGATCALLAAGASVCHVDASKGMVERAGENVRLSNLGDKPVRFIIDDCVKFVKREIRRGRKYDAIIMDPPSYGRGPNGEMWKIEEQLFDLVKLCSEVLSDNPLFFLINSYTTGLQPAVLKNILTLTVQKGRGRVEAYEVGLPTDEGICLPCGAGGMFINE
ncbi:MAG: class I SAM-dependent methyltransferase [Clostridia bacterium]|nr:class I SAM-dependent methyltransferase [Clostridia bacterium]MBR2933317.1 class I SAM-dependent methyltransferase [Clostridia bacterium]